MINDYRCLNCNSISEHWSNNKQVEDLCCEGFIAEKIISGGNFSLPESTQPFLRQPINGLNATGKLTIPSLKG